MTNSHFEDSTSHNNQLKKVRDTSDSYINLNLNNKRELSSKGLKERINWKLCKVESESVLSHVGK